MIEHLSFSHERKNRFLALALLAGMICVCGLSALAQDSAEHQTSAVSGVSVFGGPSVRANQDTAFGGADLNVALPLGEHFGLQFGGDPSILNGAWIGSAEAHLFARTPSHGMIGFYGSYTGWSGWGGSEIPSIYTDVFDKQSSLIRAGIEAEYYFRNWTVSALGGWKNSGESQFFFDSRLSFYPGDYTKLYVGYEFTSRWLADQGFRLFDTDGTLVDAGTHKSPDMSIAKIGLEHILPFDVSSHLNGTSLYAEAQFGEEGYASAMVGLRFRAKARSQLADIDASVQSSGDRGKSLIARDRTDNVLNWLSIDPRKGQYDKMSQVVDAPPICTPPGGTCSFTDPGACCSLICMASGGGPVCG